MNWLHYLLEANIYLAVFYTVYCLFLNKETHYSFNRVYLLLSCAVSFVFPVVQISTLKQSLPLIANTVNQALTANDLRLSPTIITHPRYTDNFSWADALWFVYVAGVIVGCLMLIIKLFKLIQLTKATGTLVNKGYKLINIEHANTAFSFFNYLFIGTNTNARETIISHELVHIRQKHSFDILFVEMIRIANWFNPIIYLMQMSLKTLHEYLADEQTAEGSDAISYASLLVNNACGLNGPSVTHSFFNYNLLKKRIIMLNKKRSGSLTKLKYLVVVPTCAVVLCASTLAFSKNYALIDIEPLPEKTAYSKIAFQPFLNYLNDNLGYPDKALKENTPGNVNCLIEINNHHITNIKVTNSTGQVFSRQLLNCLKQYNKNITVKTGSYALYIQFVVQGPNTFSADMQNFNKEKYPCITSLVQIGYSTTLNAGKQNLVL